MVNGKVIVLENYPENKMAKIVDLEKGTYIETIVMTKEEWRKFIKEKICF